MTRSRSAALVVVPTLAVGVLITAHLSLAFYVDPAVVSRWWEATSLGTALVLLSPRRWTRGLLPLVGLLVLVASLSAGTGLAFSIGFAVANLAEAAVVVGCLTGFEVERPGLRTWADLRRWMAAIGLGGLTAGLVTAATLGLLGAGDLWRPLLWIALTHAEAQAVLLPLVLARPRHRVRVRPAEAVWHVALLLLAATACVTANRTQPVAFLLLPLLVWAAARFRATWACVELAVVAVGLGVLTALGGGPFAHTAPVRTLLDIAGSAQAVIAVGAVTTISFVVAMSHLRDSLRTIRENEAQLGHLLDSANGTAFVATDEHGLVSWFSPGAEAMLGWTAEEVVGRQTPMLFHDTREALARAGELGVTADFGVVTALVDGGACQDTRDWTYVRKDGTRLSVSVGVTVVRDADGRPTGHLAVVRDVTDRRAAEQALVFALDRERETTRRMVELDRAKGEFVSSVSHELRTPLTSIVGYTELLGDEEVADNLTPVQRQLVERIERNGERLLMLVEDLLTLAKIEDGSFELVTARVDLRDCVVRACDEMVHTAHQRRVRLDVDVPAEAVCVDGDAAHLERVALNLVSNAVKFTPGGGQVEVVLTTDGQAARLAVRDTGLGIPLAEQPRIFERFFRSSTASEHAIQGTGLGLNIVRAITRAHGGDVGFTSAPGEGTVFTATVPRASAPPLAPAPLEVAPVEDLELPLVPPRL